MKNNYGIGKFRPPLHLLTEWGTIPPMLNHDVTTLESGLTLIRVPMPAVQSVTVLALVNAGSRYEPTQWWGISHFLEHMVFKGTERYADAHALSSAVDAVGARFNAFTSKEYTGYYVQAISKHLRLGLDVVSDMLLTPRLLQSDIDREKGVIIEEINMYADMPSSHIANLFEQMAYNMDTLGHDVIGTKETVSALTSEDFQQYVQQWYGLKNVVLVLAGDENVLKQDATVDLVKEMFSKGNAAKRGAEQAKNHLGATPLTANQFHLEYKKTEQAHLVMGFPAFNRTDPRRYALALLAVALGGGMSSRLFTEVREKRGLCYYVSADTDYYHDTGLFGAAAGVDPKRVDEALSVIMDEFLAVLTDKRAVTQEELTKAKEFFAGKFVLDLEDSENVAQYFGMKQLLLGKVESPEALMAKYAAVTLDQVHAVAAEIIQEKSLRAALIGPFRERERFEQILHIK